MGKRMLSPWEKGQIEAMYKNELKEIKEGLDRCRNDQNVLELTLKELAQSFSVIYST